MSLSQRDDYAVWFPPGRPAGFYSPLWFDDPPALVGGGVEDKGIIDGSATLFM